MDFFRLAGPALRALPPETAHRLTIRALAAGLAPRPPAVDDPVLACRVWDLDFRNPIGLAAGFDKNAEVVDPMLRLGFGFVEAGSVTPRPQPGNPRPRLFRLPEQGAVINRLGFNNEGLGTFAHRLRLRGARGRTPGVVGANLGKNRDSEDAAADYAAGVRAVAALADYLVVNVSSPNTPGLRALQRREALDHLLRTVLAARGGRKPPLLVKVAPDLTEEEIEDIAASVIETGTDGIVVSNTTVARPPGLPTEVAAEQGGLSGRPLFEPSTRVLAAFHRATAGRVPLVGVGGVSSGSDAYAKIRAGASLVQLYTALVYRGPGLVGRINRDLADLLRRDGFGSVAEAVGTDTGAAAGPAQLAPESGPADSPSQPPATPYIPAGQQGAMRVNSERRQLYSSSNGDRWFLVRDRASGQVFVLHEANRSSGGRVTQTDIGAFLSRGGQGPEHQALLALIGTLVDDASNTEDGGSDMPHLIPS